MLEMDPETPQSTVTAEHGKQLAYRLRTQQNLHKQLSFSGISASTKYTPDGQVTPVYRTINSLSSMKSTKIFPGRIRKRVVLKNGNVNLCKEHVDKRNQRYLQDTFTTMLD